MAKEPARSYQSNGAKSGLGYLRRRRRKFRARQITLPG
jgi:hypothetical protein